MTKRIITISRQYGSGGREIGRLVAEKLGIPYYDRNLVNHVAEESGFSKEFIEQSGEHASSTSSLLFNIANSAFGQGLLMGAGGDPLSLSDRVFVAQSNVITKLAEQGPCVIVGRCADYVLRDREDCLNVLIHANDDFREDRIVSLYGEDPLKAKKTLKQRDDKRKVHYKHYTGVAWGLAENYHLTLDSSLIGVEACADMIVAIVRSTEETK